MPFSLPNDDVTTTATTTIINVKKNKNFIFEHRSAYSSSARVEARKFFVGGYVKQDCEKIFDWLVEDLLCCGVVLLSSPSRCHPTNGKILFSNYFSALTQVCCCCVVFVLLGDKNQFGTWWSCQFIMGAIK